MKLVYCISCADTVCLAVGEWRSCACGRVGGIYADMATAYVCGPGAFPFGLATDDFVEARREAEGDLADRRARDWGHPIEAFTIPWNADTLRWCSEPPVGEDGIDRMLERAGHGPGALRQVRHSGFCGQCGEEVVSRHRHDFTGCGCGATRLDGGTDSRRVIGDIRNFIRTSLFVAEVPKPAAKEEVRSAR